MLKKMVTTLALAAAIGAAGLMALPDTADARAFFFPHRHFFGHHLNNRFFFGGPIFLGPPIIYETPDYGPGPCYWLRIRAARTGSSYWWHRYQECRFG